MARMSLLAFKLVLGLSVVCVSNCGGAPTIELSYGSSYTWYNGKSWWDMTVNATLANFDPKTFLNLTLMVNLDASPTKNGYILYTDFNNSRIYINPTIPYIKDHIQYLSFGKLGFTHTIKNMTGDYTFYGYYGDPKNPSVAKSTKTHIPFINSGASLNNVVDYPVLAFISIIYLLVSKNC